MVFYFTSDTTDHRPVTLFMGVHKYENEDLIMCGRPEDVWFHVDKYSSAHVYLRLKFGQTIDDIPDSVLEDVAQLVKANSIEGNKVNDIDVIYTMWTNLKKTQGMDVGQVGFHNQKEVRKIHVSTRLNSIVNRLNKTKELVVVNLRAEKRLRDKEELRAKRKAKRKSSKEVKENSQNPDLVQNSENQPRIKLNSGKRKRDASK